MAKLAAGIDIGSLYTKTVLLGLDGRLAAYSVQRSGAAYRGAAEASYHEALRNADSNDSDVAYIVATGYGRAIVPCANSQVTEITCHARGASSLCPAARTIIDIGGQDSKVIYVDGEGRVTNFVMNDKCAAGTGRFLEVMAGALGVSLEQMSELAAQAGEKLEISSICTVFAESEIISLLAQGKTRADIVAAIYQAIARRITGMVAQLGVRERVVMTGGVAQSPGMRRALGEKLNTSLLVPAMPQLVGAWGAALIAAERARRPGE